MLDSIPYELWLNSLMYQTATYKVAREYLAKMEKDACVLDLGCGFLGKLYGYVYPFTKDITGVDVPVVTELLQNVSFGRWVGWDLNDPTLKLGRAFDLIIAADSIEHVLKFWNLLEIIKNHSHEKTIVVLSTPDANTCICQRNDHKHQFTKDDIVSLLEDFKIIKAQSIVEVDARPRYASALVEFGLR